MEKEETTVEAGVASPDEICKPKDTDKILTKNKELEKNGMKEMEEDCNVNGKREASKTDEGNDSKEEKKKGEEMEEDSKVHKKGEALGTGEDNGTEKAKNKEKEMDVDSKVNGKGEYLSTGEENDVEEQKNIEVEMEVDSKENGKGEALSTGKENDAQEQKNGEEDIKENRNSEGLRNDDENGSKGENAKEEEEHTEAVGSLKSDEENDDMVEDTEKIEAEKEESKHGEEKTEESKHEEEKTKESKDEQGRKNRRRGKSVVAKEENKKKVDEKIAKEPITPAVFYTDRPVRERKTVERLVSIIEKDSTKEFRIEKGRGTALKDIPNVAYKLSRKKFEETFKMLHVILFGRRGKAVNVKNNLSRFSGFAWHENEEKQKLKIKEKFDKYVKEKLVEICDVLDIHVAKATTRKEDIVTKLLDFLVAPHATTDILLAEKEQPIKGTKRKREYAKTEYNFGSPTAKRSARKQRKADDIPKEEKSAHETEDESVEDDEENENEVPAGSEEEVAEHSENEDKEDESEEETGKHKNGSMKSPAKNKSSKKPTANKVATPKAATVVSSPEKPSSKSSSKHAMPVTTDVSPKVFSRKKKDVEAAKTKSSTMSKSATKEQASNEKTGKKVSRGKNTSREDSGPTEDEVRKVIYDILKDADLNTATFTDILKQLAQHFGMDFAPNKSSVKLMIQEELTKLADEAEELGGDEDETKGEKKEVQEPVGYAVEA